MISHSSQPKRRSLSHEEIDAEGSWAISYGDMVTLLLTFFILFFNVNQKSSESSRKLQTALLTELGAKANDQPKDLGKTEPKLNTGTVADSSTIDEQTLKTWGGIPHSIGSRVMIEFPNTSFFKFGSTRLTTEGTAVLKAFTARYMGYAGGNSISIKSFTDSVKVDSRKSRRLRRPFEDNLELSALRSIAAMRVLQTAGIPLNRMRIAGNGELEREIRTTVRTPARAEPGDPRSRKVVLLIEPITPEKRD